VVVSCGYLLVISSEATPSAYSFTSLPLLIEPSKRRGYLTLISASASSSKVFGVMPVTISAAMSINGSAFGTKLATVSRAFCAVPEVKKLETFERMLLMFMVSF
jgi:hypothetical protein